MEDLSQKVEKFFFDYIEKFTKINLLPMFGRNVNIRLIEVEEDTVALSGTSLLMDDIYQIPKMPLRIGGKSAHNR